MTETTEAPSAEKPSTYSIATLAQALAADREGVDIYVYAIPVEEIPPHLLMLDPLNKAIKRAKIGLEARYTAEVAAKRAPAVYVERVAGAEPRAFVFKGAVGDWEYTDPLGFLNELAKIGVPKKERDVLVKIEISTTEVNALRDRWLPLVGEDEKAAKVIAAINRSRERRPDGPAHMVPSK